MIVQVTHMTAKLTTTGKPFWTCRTDHPEVKTVNVFDPLPGFKDEMVAMQVDEVIQWSKPIECSLYQNGKYWNFDHLLAPRDGHEVVKPYVPDLAAWRQYAIETALGWKLLDSAVLDTETTGLDPDSQVFDLAVVSLNEPYTSFKETDFQSYVHCDAAHLPSIVELPIGVDLQNAPDWTRVRLSLMEACMRRAVIAYNAPFDATRIAYMDVRTRVRPVDGMFWLDAMPLVSWFLGLWDASKQHWTSITLKEAYAQIMGETMDAAGLTAHGAKDDAEATKRIVNKIAAGAQDE